MKRLTESAPVDADDRSICELLDHSPMAVATNTGILAMLGVVVGVLACFAAFFVHLMRRAKMMEQSEGSAR